MGRSTHFYWFESEIEEDTGLELRIWNDGWQQEESDRKTETEGWNWQVFVEHWKRTKPWEDKQRWERIGRD